MSPIKRADRDVMWRIKNAYGYVTWLIKHAYRYVALFFGAGLFLIFGLLQALVIERHVAEAGWLWCLAWPFAIVLGYTPILGALAAAKVASGVWFGPWFAIAFFLAPFWLFTLLAIVPTVMFRRPSRTTLRILRAPSPRKNLAVQAQRWPRAP